MRTTCYDCGMKHLGSAAVADIEVCMGYPQFKLWVIGNLDHAAQELYESNPALAMLIREHRLSWQERDGDYKIPYEELAGFVDTCKKAEACGLNLPEIPYACWGTLSRPQHVAGTEPKRAPQPEPELSDQKT